MTTALHSQTPHPPHHGALYQPAQHGSMEDLEEQVSGLNTSGANSTIHEYVNMLSVNDETDSKDYDAIFRMVAPPKRQPKSQNKRSSLEIKLSSQENLYNLGVTSGYATTRTGAKAEAYSTLKDLKNLIKQPNHKKRESDLGVIKEKGKDITRTSPPLKSKMGYSKSCSKQSISKITASFQHTNFGIKGSSGFNSSNQKSRRIPTEGNSKEIKQFSQTSRLSTMPNEERQTFTEVMSPKTIAKQYINLGSPTGEHKNKNLMSPTSVGSHKRENSSQSPGRSLQISLRPLNGGSISRAVHAIATSRIDITRDKKGSQQHYTTKSETARKSEDHRAEAKNAKENKPLKAVKIDIVEVSLAPKSVKKSKDRAGECMEKIDDNFEKLRKLINDKRVDISQNEILLKALENLNTYIIGTQTLIQTSKLSS